MYVNMRLPKVEPQEIEPPTHCPLPDPSNPQQKCNGVHFKPHQLDCQKPLRDTSHTQVFARRYRCLKCGRTFRVYPTGVTQAHQSNTLIAFSRLLYILGWSYQEAADLLEALGYPLSKTTVYENVRTAGSAIRLRKQWFQEHLSSAKVLNYDFASDPRLGRDTVLTLADAVLSGALLTIELTGDESAAMMQVAGAVGAQIVGTDEVESQKTTANQPALSQRMDRTYVSRTTRPVMDVFGLIASKGALVL